MSNNQMNPEVQKVMEWVMNNQMNPEVQKVMDLLEDWQKEIILESGILTDSLIENANRVDEANQFAYEHLGDVKREPNDTVYDHSVRVAESVMRSPEWHKASQDADHRLTADLTIAAVLHDVVEDSDADIHTVLDMFGSRVAEAVDVLTHNKNESYEDYLRLVEANPIARVVKRADMADNLSTAPYQSRWFDKYARAFSQLAEPF